MTYKKYIKRGDKIYGPYVYHSSRENGKVISTYHGKNKNAGFKKLNLKVFSIIFLSVILVTFFAYFLINFQFTGIGFSGRSILQTTATYNPGENLQGVISLNLKNGELIPDSTKVIVEMSGQEHVYELSELMGDKINQTSGDFYVEDKEISGNGVGYGTVGVKETYPEISFLLNIIPETENPPAQSESPQEPTEEIPQEPTEEEQPPTTEEEPQEPTEEIPQEPTEEATNN